MIGCYQETAIRFINMMTHYLNQDCTLNKLQQKIILKTSLGETSLRQRERERERNNISLYVWVGGLVCVYVCFSRQESGAYLMNNSVHSLEMLSQDGCLQLTCSRVHLSLTC